VSEKVGPILPAEEKEKKKSRAISCKEKRGGFVLPSPLRGREMSIARRKGDNLPGQSVEKKKKGQSEGTISSPPIMNNGEKGGGAVIFRSTASWS